MRVLITCEIYILLQEEWKNFLLFLYFYYFLLFLYFYIFLLLYFYTFFIIVVHQFLFNLDKQQRMILFEKIAVFEKNLIDTYNIYF